MRIDEEACCGHARCVAVAPEAFELDEDTDVARLRPQAAEVDPDLLSAAARSCPERAITLSTGTGANVIRDQMRSGTI